MKPHERKQAAEAMFPAKVTPPKVAHALARPRLFAQLDQCLQKDISWVMAPAGTGKTTCVAHYLHTRAVPTVWYSCDEGDADAATFFYYMREAARRVLGRKAAQLPMLRADGADEIELFARRFFEHLSRLLVAHSPGSERTVVVFDNFQDVPLSDAMQKILSGGPEGLSEGVRAIIISRDEPPPVLVRVQAGEQMARMDFHDLRFTLDETHALVKLRQPRMAENATLHLQELTQGWVAGLTLILAGQNHGKVGNETPHQAGVNAILNYFAEEIFARLAPEWQRFLLETSLLATVSVPVATELASNDTAEQILASLCRNYLFIKRLDGAGNEYEYHPLLREFLLAKAKRHYSLAELNLLYQRAAQLQEQSQRMEDAAVLYAEAGDSAGLARMAKANAESLLAQGRDQTLQSWLDAIEGAAATDPWVLYWRGICNLNKYPVNARVHLQNALDRFLSCGERKGSYLAWAGLVDTWTFGFDDWRPLDHCIALFEELQAEDAEFPDRITELTVVPRLLTALALARMDQPSLIERWIDRMNQLLEQPTPTELRMSAFFAMSIYHLWRGDYQKNAILLEKAQAELRLQQLPPFVSIRIQLMVAVHAWLSANYAAAHRAADDGLALARKHGIRTFSSLLWSFKVTADLVQGKLEQGTASLTAQLEALIGPEQALDVFFYHINAAWLAMLVNQPLRAHEHLQMVGRKVERIGNRYYQALWHLGMAQAEFLLDHTEAAMEHTCQARNIGTTTDSSVIQWYALGVEAWQLLTLKRPAEGLLALHRALALGRRNGYIHLEMFLPEVMRFLLLRALEEKIEPEFVRSVIRSVKLTPPMEAKDHSLSIASQLYWPFRVRIRTLGQFEVRIQEELLSFSGKEKKKPLEMLKALIALGSVDVSEELLADQLWPASEGDLAHKSLETTLSRLRKMLGSETSVLFRSHRITLNPAECWVDCQALQQILPCLNNLEPEEGKALAAHALGLCQGSFLPGETSIDCFSGYRERMREQQLAVLRWLGSTAECAAEWSRAAEYYQRATVFDPLGEEYFVRLMLCQRQLGNLSAAVRTYLRCEQNLRAGLEVEPSPETQALYRSLIRLSGGRQ